jgi:hypothetical protein
LFINPQTDGNELKKAVTERALQQKKGRDISPPLLPKNSIFKLGGSQEKKIRELPVLIFDTYFLKAIYYLGAAT